MIEPIIIKQNNKNNLKFAVLMVIAFLIVILALIFDFRTENSSGIFAVLYQNKVVYNIFRALLFLCMIIIAYCLIFILIRAKKGKHLLVVDENGITDNSSAISLGYIPWCDIERVYVDSFINTDFIEVELKNNEIYLEKVNLLKRKAIIANLKLGHQAVCISLSTEKIMPYDIFPKIQEIFIKKQS